MTAAGQPTLLITTLAMYQTEFWVEVAERLRAAGQAPAFLSFDDRSSELLNQRGFRTWAARVPAVAPAITDAGFSASVAAYGMSDINYWLAHERVTFDVRDSALLRTKLLAYLSLAERACKELLAEGPVVMVQELGGFLSVVASYFAARNCGVDNWFIEPSFFRGRLFFLRNTFAAQRIPPAEAEGVSDAVRAYLDNTLKQKAIVVPQKDRHQYTTAFRKIVNRRNFKRLAEKAVDKYLLGKHQEFGHIGSHVSRHARMLINSARLRSCYKPLAELGPFIYYPLHVPGDMALTLRSPQYLDQLALIDYLARSIPHTHQLAIKEHPAMIGALDATRLRALLARYDNLHLIAPSTNNYEVLGACDAVVSVNSKSGAEALLLNKKVFVLGDAFYRDCPLATAVPHLTDLPALLAAALACPAPVHDTAPYFEQVWRRSLPGELYVCESANVTAFTTSLLQALAR